jgi:hypothetical protein
MLIISCTVVEDFLINFFNVLCLRERVVFVPYPVVATSLDQVKPPVAETVPLWDPLHIP